ncbi:hypothetical protein DPMN_061802 [Dreissena polymorpha]|uniref:Uncharacterized protein n=1 Tax=Dreissena polymorpha TaxID=45954 RepID=A0A9D4C8C7_DREPO|nr:hypothetical protein DPMN_061802 [Dreissena polymorpha]
MLILASTSKNFHPPTLKIFPQIQSVKGMKRYNLKIAKERMNTTKAAQKVAKEIYAKYKHGTAFCISLSTIQT